MLGTDTENISLTGAAQGHFDVPDTINTIGSHPGKRNALCQRPLDHGTGKRRFGGEAGFRRHMDLAAPFGIVRPDLRQIERPVNKGVPVA